MSRTWFGLEKLPQWNFEKYASFQIFLELSQKQARNRLRTHIKKHRLIQLSFRVDISWKEFNVINSAVATIVHPTHLPCYAPSEKFNLLTQSQPLLWYVYTIFTFFSNCSRLYLVRVRVSVSIINKLMVFMLRKAVLPPNGSAGWRSPGIGGRLPAGYPWRLEKHCR